MCRKRQVDVVKDYFIPFFEIILIKSYDILYLIRQREWKNSFIFEVLQKNLFSIYCILLCARQKNKVKKNFYIHIRVGTPKSKVTPTKNRRYPRQSPPPNAKENYWGYVQNNLFAADGQISILAIFSIMLHKQFWPFS